MIIFNDLMIIEHLTMLHFEKKLIFLIELRVVK